MKVSIEQIQKAIELYFNQEILPKAVGFKKFTTALVFNMYKPKLQDLLINLADNHIVKMSGVVDEQQFVNIDALYNYAKDAVQKSGQFEVLGIIFTETDLDKVYSLLHTNQGGQ